MSFPDDSDPRFGTEYTEHGYGMFPSGPPNYPTPPNGRTFSNRSTPPYPPHPQPCSPDQEFVPRFGCLYPCTMEQLTRDGYRPPNPVYPPYPVNRNPEVRTEQEQARPYTANIHIRCLEPPLLPPPEKLTIVEVRPPAPPAPPPEITHGQRPRTPSTPPALIFREQPPKTPLLPHKETCYVKLPPPPRPPAQRIHHEYHPPPSKAPDIIIERWLPFKRQLPDPHDKEIVHPPPYNPEPLRHVIIQHIHPQPRFNHRIEKEPRPRLTNPRAYEQEHGHTLLPIDELMPRVLAELSRWHASEDIVRRLRAIFRVPCNETQQPMSPNPFQFNLFSNLAIEQQLQPI